MRVFIVEDSEPVLEQLQRALRAMPWVDVVGSAGGEQRAFERIGALRPDLVLLDLSLAEGHGMALLRRLKAAAAPCCTWVLSQHDEARYRSLALELGAGAFYAKATQSQQLFDDLRALLPPVPGAAAEAARLQALQASGMFDDDSVSMVFDSVCRQARATLDADMACVALIGADEVRIKACAGGPRRVGSRGGSPCAHVVDADAAVQWQRGEPTFGRGERRLDAGQLDWLNSLAQAASCELEWRVCLSRGASRWPDSGGLRDDPDDDRPDGAAAAPRAPLVRLERGFEASRDASAHAQAGGRQALFKLDIDGYRFVRDGLDEGQRRALLQTLERRMAELLPAGSMVEHLGDDEFIALLPFDEPQRLEQQAQALLAALSEPIVLQRTARRLTLSLGMALAPEHGLDIDALLAHAEQARLVAKAQGGNCARVFRPEQRQAGLQHLELESELALAIQRHAIDVAFQPQWSLADGRLSGVEVLARWWHPRFGAVAPQRFIALAEQRGLMAALGASILERALATMAGWRAEGIAPPRLALNVSSAQFDGAFVDLLEATLRARALDARAIELELTESRRFSESAAFEPLVERVVGAGCAIAIDDFGTGYSSLDLLRRLPAATLKIDRGFVHGVQPDTRGWRVLAGMVDLARRLGMRCVAEGIETDAERQLVGELGCSDAQGYWLARPMRADAMGHWLREYARRGNVLSVAPQSS
jgi:EAL domain-containing protein (putative c-di-GMP-specific phosphodiesterase class I)/GGDEF domain-containing protein/DNA-binding response OmpR family regulator